MIPIDRVAPGRQRRILARRDLCRPHHEPDPDQMSFLGGGRMDEHPMQPLVLDKEGTIRFKKNKIIDRLFTEGKIDLNRIFTWTDIPAEDRMQLAQLMGYSLAGYGELGYVTDESYDLAVEQAQKKGYYRRQKTGEEE